MPINISKLPYVSICSRLIAISLYRYCALDWPIVILVNPLYFLFLWPDFVIALYIVVLFRMQKPLERISRIVDAVKKLSSNQFPRLFQALNSCFLGDRHPHNITPEVRTPRWWRHVLGPCSWQKRPVGLFQLQLCRLLPVAASISASIRCMWIPVHFGVHFGVHFAFFS